MIDLTFYSGIVMVISAVSLALMILDYDSYGGWKDKILDWVGVLLFANFMWTILYLFGSAIFSILAVNQYTTSVIPLTCDNPIKFVKVEKYIGSDGKKTSMVSIILYEERYGIKHPVYVDKWSITNEPDPYAERDVQIDIKSKWYWCMDIMETNTIYFIPNLPMQEVIKN